ncbi:40S ribosomal protein S24 [Intoshia linei]|uniref:40S ribosomal protein S24 n=1 Tax=Intoshia linei TaxID=1819745 RepID=A0A177B0K9_9BILA|nr:40S ribosomal protein S24 [Intoshia linei]
MTHHRNRSENQVTIRTRHYMTNRLMCRKQMIIDVLHPNICVPSREYIKKWMSARFKTAADLIALYGMQTKFGGGRSVGYALVYDNMDMMKKLEPRHRLVKAGLVEKIKKATNRQTVKKDKNRRKKVRGIKKCKIGAKK